MIEMAEMNLWVKSNAYLPCERRGPTTARAREFGLMEPHAAAYNPSLDAVSDGAVQARAWKEYKENGTAGGQKEKETLDEEDVVEEKKKDYGKHYPCVWTKDPHGGGYRIDKGPGARSGYDALEQKSDGTMIARAPGYEKPQTGPTTNFVGNHMTQGAIDLVQYELTKLDPGREIQRTRLDRARGIVRKLPELTAVSREDPSPCDVRASIEKFSWWDTGERIQLRIRHCDLQSAILDEISVEYADRRVSVEIQKVTSNVLSKHVYILVLEHLFRAIIPELCTRLVDDEGLLINLTKADQSIRWLNLRAPPVMSLPPKVSSGLVLQQQTLDMRALRAKLIGDREGKLAPKLEWLTTNVAEMHDFPFDQFESISTADTIECVRTQIDCGDYVEALSFITRGLRDSTISASEKVVLLEFRAQANVQLGSLKDAVSDYSEILEVQPSAVMFFKKASVREQLEDYHGALIDYENAQALNGKDVKVLEAIRRVRECSTAKTRMEEEEQRYSSGGDGFQSVPRPCLPQFENRGKAGACF